jgi:hypothetical protein
MNAAKVCQRLSEKRKSFLLVHRGGCELVILIQNPFYYNLVMSNTL